MQVIGQYHHDASGGHADQKGEIGDIKSPGGIPAQTGDTQTETELF